MRETTDYTTEAVRDAQDAARNFLDEIVSYLLEDGEAPDDLFNDYSNGDSYHHENHEDRDYDLTDAAEILDQLDDHEETDKGLWEGLSPRRAISCQAAYTYSNAVMWHWREVVRAINDSEEIKEFLSVREDAEQDGEDVREILTGLVRSVIDDY